MAAKVTINRAAADILTGRAVAALNRGAHRASVPYWPCVFAHTAATVAFAAPQR
jgi:hypothetical protein